MRKFLRFSFVAVALLTGAWVFLAVYYPYGWPVADKRVRQIAKQLRGFSFSRIVLEVSSTEGRQFYESSDPRHMEALIRGMENATHIPGISALDSTTYLMFVSPRNDSRVLFGFSLDRMDTSVGPAFAAAVRDLMKTKPITEDEAVDHRMDLFDMKHRPRTRIQSRRLGNSQEPAF